LYAAGECGCASFHGFNRLGTNSILELITMGKFVGDAVVGFMGSRPMEPKRDAGDQTLDQFQRYLNSNGSQNIDGLRNDLRQMMTAKVGVFRNQVGLDQALDGIDLLNKEAVRAGLKSKSLRMNQELIQRWELDNLLAVAATIAAGALRRKETRGGHARSDYPERSDDFNQHTLVYMDDGGQIQFSERKVEMQIFDQGGPNHEKFGMIERKY
jgi:succinate dehydrogenase/fumarate reductase flavoprotein subunit